MARNYTMGERALMAIATMAGKDYATINHLLHEEQKKSGNTRRDLNPRSFFMLQQWYTKDMAGGFTDREKDALQSLFQNILCHVESPKTLTQLSESSTNE